MGASAKGALHHAGTASFRLGSALLERGAGYDGTGHRGAAVAAGSLGTARAIRDRAERRRKEIPPTARGQGRSAREHLAGCLAAGIYADATDRAGVGARGERVTAGEPAAGGSRVAAGAIPGTARELGAAEGEGVERFGCSAALGI